MGSCLAAQTRNETTIVTTDSRMDAPNGASSIPISTDHDCPPQPNPKETTTFKGDKTKQTNARSQETVDPEPATQSQEVPPSPTGIFSRTWLHRRFAAEAINDRFTLTIATWNILADGLTGIHGGKTKEFAGVPREYLEVGYRVPLLLSQIQMCAADVICLQEFDLYANEEFMSGMQGLGYEIAGRQDKLWSPCTGMGMPPDGVAIFFQEDKFTVDRTASTDQVQHKRWMSDALAEHSEEVEDDGRISIEDFGLWTDPKGNDSDKHVNIIIAAIKAQELVDPDFADNDGTVGVAALKDWLNQPKTPVSFCARLIPKEKSDVPICVITSHLVSSKKKWAEKQRRSEVEHLLAHAEYEELRQGAHTFFTADMNASWQKWNDYLPKAYPYVVGSVPSNADLGDDGKVEQEDQLFKSSTRDEDEVELPWTSWKKRKTDDGVTALKYGVDFVFYPCKDWEVLKVLDLPTEEDLISGARDVQREFNLDDEPTPLPNKRYPSDHVLVCSEFCFVGST